MFKKILKKIEDTVRKVINEELCNFIDTIKDVLIKKGLVIQEHRGYNEYSFKDLVGHVVYIRPRFSEEEDIIIVKVVGVVESSSYQINKKHSRQLAIIDEDGTNHVLKDVYNYDIMKRETFI